MKARMPKSLGPTTKPSQEKAEKQAAQSAGDEAANMLESAEANIIPFEPTTEPEASRAENGPETPATGQNTAEIAENTPEASRAITSEAEPGKATVDAGEGVTFQSVADGYAPRGSGQDVPEKPAHVLMYERCLAEATQRHLDTCLARQQAQAELKALKDEEKHALELVSKIKAGGPEWYIEPKKAQPTAEITAESSNATDGVTSSQPGVNTESDAWRNAPLAELDLKPKLQERLEEAGISTIGDLEDLRAAIANGKKEWPKGIGTAKVTAIEEAVLTWLAKNQQREESASVGVDKTPGNSPISDENTAETAEKPTSHVVDETAASDDQLKASPEQYPSQELWDSWTEKAQTKWIEARADALHELIMAGNDPEPSSEYDHSLDASPHLLWDEGADARTEGDGLENCPHPPGLAMDLWIRGWLGAVQAEVDLDKQAPLQDEPEPEQDEPELATAAATSSSPSPGLFELDDLDDL